MAWTVLSHYFLVWPSFRVFCGHLCTGLCHRSDYEKLLKCIVIHLPETCREFLERISCAISCRASLSLRRCILGQSFAEFVGGIGMQSLSQSVKYYRPWFVCPSHWTTVLLLMICDVILLKLITFCDHKRQQTVSPHHNAVTFKCWTE